MRRPLLLALFATLAAPAHAEVPDVITDTPVVQSLVAMVMGDKGTPAVLLDKGGDAHDFQLRPSQVRALSDAGLVVWLGQEMAPWLADAIAEDDGPHTLALLHTPGVHLLQFEPDEDHDHDHDAEAEDDHDHDHDHDHDAAAGEDEEEHHHHHEGTDPHAWLDPDNAMLWLGQIAERLGTLDPDNADLYAANAKVAQTRVRMIDEVLKAELAPAAGKPILTAHDAYHYFAEHYGITLAASVARGDASAPGAAHLSAVESDLASGKVACAFPEVLRNPKSITSLAEEAGARVGAPLDPEGRAIEPGPDLYITLMEGLGKSVAECIKAD